MKKMTYYFTEVKNEKDLRAVRKDMVDCGAEINCAWLCENDEAIVEAAVPENFMEKFEKTKSY